MPDFSSAVSDWTVAQVDELNPSETVTATEPAKGGDVARFDELLGQERTQSVQASESAYAIHPSTESPKAMGEIILAKLDQVGTAYKENVGKTYEVLEKAPNEISLHELMKLQLDVSVVTLEIEVVGKGVQKAVQHFDTFTKLQ